MAELRAETGAGGTKSSGPHSGDQMSGLAFGSATGSALEVGLPAPCMEEHVAWPTLSRLPVTLEAKIPVIRFTLRDLLGLVCGQTIESAWPVDEDVPLKVGELQVSWSEFDVVGEHLALRLTRLA